MLDRGDSVDAVYMDFQKAFDKVPHKRLLGKLHTYGVPENIVRWIESFLVGRRQRVRVNGSYSGWADVCSGIPQGSVLGPTLFIIYINDLPDDLLNEVYMFADDTKIFGRANDKTDAATIQEDLSTLQAWSDTWLLKFHEGKCKVMSMGKRNREMFSYSLNDVVLEQVDQEKDLGVVTDSKLKFSSHINEKVNKANKIMGVIRRSFKSLDLSTFAKLFKGLVRPHLEYAAPVWNPHLKKDITTLENVQRRATKQVPELKNLSYEDRLRQLRLPSLAYRRLRGDMIETFKILSGYYDTSVADFLCRYDQNVDDANRQRGHAKKLFKRRSRLNIRKYSFPFRIVDTWNSLPAAVVDAPSINSFENRLDRFWKEQDLVYDYSACIKKLSRTWNPEQFQEGDADLSLEA